MKFGVREICDVVMRAKNNMTIGNMNFEADAPVFYFDSLKTSTLESAVTTVYAQGGKGNTNLVAWDGEKTVTFTMEDALISPVSLAMLSGADVLESTTNMTAGSYIYVEKTTGKKLPDSEDLDDNIYVENGKIVITGLIYKPYMKKVGNQEIVEIDVFGAKQDNAGGPVDFLTPATGVEESDTTRGVQPLSIIVDADNGYTLNTKEGTYTLTGARYDDAVSVSTEDLTAMFPGGNNSIKVVLKYRMGIDASTTYVHATETIQIEDRNQGDGQYTLYGEISNLPHISTSEGADKYFAYLIPLDANGDIKGQPIKIKDSVTITNGPKSGKYQVIFTNPESGGNEGVEEVGGYIDNSKGLFLFDYYYVTDKAVTTMNITPDKFAGSYYLEASTLFRTRSGKDLPAEFIIPNCKIQSNFTFTMASSGDPSTFTFTIDAFPDYPKHSPTKKVLAAIQILEGEDGSTTSASNNLIGIEDYTGS